MGLLGHTLGSGQKALDKTTKMAKTKGILAEILVDYSILELVKYKLEMAKAKIIHIQYDDKATILAEMLEDDYQEFLLNANNREKYHIKTKILQKKFVDIPTKTR